MCIRLHVCLFLRAHSFVFRTSLFYLIYINKIHPYFLLQLLSQISNIHTYIRMDACELL